MEQQLNIFFNHRPIQLLDITKSDKESIQNIDIRQFLNDYFIDAQNYINVTKRDEVIQCHKKSNFYKKIQKPQQYHLRDIYEYNPGESWGFMSFQRYNLITEAGEHETDCGINDIANNIYRYSAIIFRHILENDTITEYREDYGTQGSRRRICNQIYEYLVELTKLTLKENNETYINHVKYEYQKAVQLLYFFENIEFYNQTYMYQTAEIMKSLLTHKWETKRLFTIKNNYPEILE